MKVKYKICAALMCLPVVVVKTWPAEPTPTNTPPAGAQSVTNLLTHGDRNPSMSAQPDLGPGLKAGFHPQPDACEPGGFFPQGVSQSGCGSAGHGSCITVPPLLGSAFVSGTRLPSRGGVAINQAGFAGIQGGLSVGASPPSTLISGGGGAGGGAGAAGGGGFFGGGAAILGGGGGFGGGGGGFAGGGGAKGVGFNGGYGI